MACVRETSWVRGFSAAHSVRLPGSWPCERMAAAMPISCVPLVSSLHGIPSVFSTGRRGDPGAACAPCMLQRALPPWVAAAHKQQGRGRGAATRSSGCMHQLLAQHRPGGDLRGPSALVPWSYVLQSHDSASRYLGAQGLHTRTRSWCC